MVFQGVLFDLDDTLMDRNKALAVFIENFKCRFSNKIKDSSLLEFQSVFQRLDCKGYKPREEMFMELLQEIGWNKRPRVEELIKYWSDEFPKCASPADGLYEVLEYFYGKGIKMGIVTNGDSHMQNSKIDVLNIRKYMEAIIISDEVKLRKPDTRIFKLALSKINIAVEKVLFVGDNLIIDVKGASDAGLMPIWIKSGCEWTGPDEKFPLYINSLKELIGLIENLKEKGAAS